MNPPKIDVCLCHIARRWKKGTEQAYWIYWISNILFKRLLKFKEAFSVSLPDDAQEHAKYSILPVMLLLVSCNFIKLDYIFEVRPLELKIKLFLTISLWIRSLTNHLFFTGLGWKLNRATKTPEGRFVGERNSKQINNGKYFFLPERRKNLLVFASLQLNECCRFF